MGIKYLNKFLKEEAKDSIKFMSISEISGKKIVVDISIYIYKYASEDSLIENIYLMLSVFRHYNIIPIFIFMNNIKNVTFLCMKYVKIPNKILRFN